MRKLIITILALGALADGAQSAVAAVPQGDDPNALFGNVLGDDWSAAQRCTTPDKEGVPGEGNAWGSYISGCTVKLECPTTAFACLAKSISDIGTAVNRDQRVTMNSRIRMFAPGETETGRWRDKSCEGVNSCGLDDRVFIQPGESASVQCNGVRADTKDNAAHVACRLGLEYR